MIYYQNQENMPDDLHHYGCYFMSLLSKNFDKLTQQQVIGLWNDAKAKDIIENDPKDAHYLEINNPDALCSLLGLPYKYVDGHFDPGTTVPENTFVVEQWYNKANGFKHFMVGDGKGNVSYDPIMGGSITHKVGVLYSLRFYTLVG
jgi:hypothetical protein